MHDALRPAAPPSRPPGAPWSVAQAAEFLGVSRATVERLLRPRELASFTVGRRRLIPDAALKQLAAG